MSSTKRSISSGSQTQIHCDPRSPAPARIHSIDTRNKQSRSERLVHHETPLLDPPHMHKGARQTVIRRQLAVSNEAWKTDIIIKLETANYVFPPRRNRRRSFPLAS